MQQDRSERQRSDAYTRALLAVFDMQAPPDFYAQVLARAGERQRPQSKRPGWMRRAWQQRGLMATRRASSSWPRLWRPVRAVAVFCLLVTGVGIYLWPSLKETQVALSQASGVLSLGVALPNDPSVGRAEEGPFDWGEPYATTGAQTGPAGESMPRNDRVPPPGDNPGSGTTSLLTAFIPVAPVRSTQRRKGSRGRHHRGTAARQHARGMSRRREWAESNACNVHDKLAYAQVG
jgi:hypothetical protein